MKIIGNKLKKAVLIYTVIIVGIFAVIFIYKFDNSINNAIEANYKNDGLTINLPMYPKFKWEDNNNKRVIVQYYISDGNSKFLNTYFLEMEDNHWRIKSINSDLMKLTFNSTIDLTFDDFWNENNND
ncbi:hypothetical protein [Flammeovirga sp. EKP202]|uniref:hypothetical protein n=1 Tax=Flammeovirga sp. EKP202 TaxID=2770592 RepID=UPI001660022B|nr:hypothetical protein [Flammeovirga sp. EKP202]MBD0401728.1 hypothetical protein [Flammeovirga sp. EKP202]